MYVCVYWNVGGGTTSSYLSSFSLILLHFLPFLVGSCGPTTIAQYSDLYQYCVQAEHTLDLTLPASVDPKLIQRLVLLQIQLFFLAMNNQDQLTSRPDAATLQQVAQGVLDSLGGNNNNNRPKNEQVYLRFEFPIAVSADLRVALRGVSENVAEFTDVNQEILIQVLSSFLQQFLNQSSSSSTAVSMQLDGIQIISFTPLSEWTAAYGGQRRQRRRQLQTTVTIPPGAAVPTTGVSLEDTGLHVDMSVQSYCAGAETCTDDALEEALANVPPNAAAGNNLSQAALEEQIRAEAAQQASDYFNSLFNVSLSTGEVDLRSNTTSDSDEVTPVSTESSADEDAFPTWLWASLLGMGLVLLSATLFVYIVVRRARAPGQKRRVRPQKNEVVNVDEGQEIPYSPQQPVATAPPAPPSTSSFYDDDDRNQLEPQSHDASYSYQPQQLSTMDHSYDQDESVYTTTTSRPLPQY
jgi:hypothetical protein